jgi:predicted SnoaL-like aldol condensation-catalyzing enzyme
MRKKDCTAAIQKSIETGERWPLSHFDSRQYIQHNLMLPDGLEAILRFMDSLPRDRTSVSVACSFEDGDYSCALAEYVLGDWGPMVGFEVHRWENGRIVEHWDNLQPLMGPNDSGRSMVDGTFEATTPTSTAAAKQLVEDFVSTVLIAGDSSKLERYFEGDALIQHGPRHGDGARAFVEGLQPANASLAIRKLHKILGEEQLVLAIAEGTRDDVSTSFYHLFRVADGKLVEHWEVLEPILPRDQWKNDNGKF